jgi:hypothetical protein
MEVHLMEEMPGGVRGLLFVAAGMGYGDVWDDRSFPFPDA